MICYKDITFCSFYKNCKEGCKCCKALTPRIIKEAKDFGLPIDCFMDKPNCWNKKDKTGG